MNNKYNLKIDIPKIDIPKLELIKNNHYDISINCNTIGKPIDKTKENNSSDTYIININSPSQDDRIIKKRKIEKSKCPGCYPIFQENQLGHIGPNGCLGDDY